MAKVLDRESEAWDLARKRVINRRDFASHAVVFCVVNCFLVAIWSVTGGGYFWPAWVIGCWGMGIVLHAWEAFLRRPVTDADVEQELERRLR